MSDIYQYNIAWKFEDEFPQQSVEDIRVGDLCTARCYRWDTPQVVLVVAVAATQEVFAFAEGIEVVWNGAQTYRRGEMMAQCLLPAGLEWITFHKLEKIDPYPWPKC